MLRPLEPADVPAVHALLTDPRLASLVGTTPYDPPSTTAALLATGWDGGPSAHRFGLFDGPHLLAFAELVPQSRPRSRHVGRLRLVGGDAQAGRRLLEAVHDLAWAWLGLGRLEVELHPDDPAMEPLLEAGYAVEFERHRHRRTPEGFASTIGLALLRVGLDRGAPRPTPSAWPTRGDLPADLVIRSATPDDAPGYGASMRTPEVRWGTLQVASRPDAAWRGLLTRADRSHGAPLVAVSEGAVVGTAGLHPEPFPSAHCAMIGMGIVPAYQGRKVGRALLEAVVEAARWYGVRRLGLEVYPDNTRAHALYRSCGFVDEGVRRAAAWRDGAIVDSAVMGRWLGD